MLLLFSLNLVHHIFISWFETLIRNSFITLLREGVDAVFSLTSHSNVWHRFLDTTVEGNNYCNNLLRRQFLIEWNYCWHYGFVKFSKNDPTILFGVLFANEPKIFLYLNINYVENSFPVLRWMRIG